MPTPAHPIFHLLTDIHAPYPRPILAELSLGAEFQRCASRAQTRNKSRKRASLLNLRLNDYSQVYFEKADRAAIPESLLQEIRCVRCCQPPHTPVGGAHRG